MPYNLGRRPNIKARNAMFSGVKDGCWLYRWLQIHSFILVIKVLFRPLIKQDLFNLKEQFWPETTYMQFGRLKKMNPQYSAAKIVYEIIKVDMTIACVLAFFEAGANFAGPIIIKYILIFLNSPPDQTETSDRNTAFALAGLWIFFCIIQLYLRQYWTRLASLCATKIEVILYTQFYRQTTRVSSTYKKYMTLGDFYSFWFVDIANITGFILNFPTIISSPTILILSVIFVCLEVGPYGMLLLAVIVLAIIIELLIDMNMSSVFSHKLSKYDIKLSENMHMYKQFKQMKQLGWESLLIKENIRYRHSQNELNKIYYILGQIYLAITNFAPVLVIFILIVVGSYSQNNAQWGTTVVFTVIGYISLISIPLRNLPNVISRLLVTRRVFLRIQNFLSADEIQTNEDLYMEEGSFTIKNLVLSIGTRSSIDRLLVRQSIMVEGQESMMVHIKNLPIEVRMYHTLDFINRQQIKKFRKLMKCVEVPFKLTYKKGDVVVLLGQKSGSGKTSFIRGFLGSLHLQSGHLKYGGKLGFVSVKDFYFQKSIKENVLFGQFYNKQKLELAYELSGLKQQLLKYTKGDQTVVTTNPNVIAQSLRCIISLARAIYYDSDILLMDDLFDQFQIDELQTLYNRICKNLPDKLIVISTNLIHFLKSTDNVIILENRCAVQVGKFGKLKQNPNSKIHNFKIADLQLIHYRSLLIDKSSRQSTQSQEQSNQVSEVSKFNPANQKLQVKVIKTTTKIKRDTINAVLTQTTLHLLGQIKDVVDLPPPLPDTVYPLTRPTPVEWKYYYALFKNGGYKYIITFIFICFANGVATFSTWLIGSYRRSPFGLDVSGALTLYACLQILFAILLLIYGMFIPKVATLNIERMSNQFNDMASRSSLEEFQKFSSVHLNFIFGGDNQNFYVICDNITNVFTSAVTLISTVIIMGLASHYIFIVGGVVTLYSVIVYYIFRIAFQEVFVLGGAPKRYFFKALQDSVDGAETLQFYDKVEWFRTKVYDGIYIFSAVWRTNLRFINHAFNILLGFAELLLMAGIMYLAIAKKQKFSSSTVIYVNVAVTASPRILGSILVLFNNLANMAALINTTIKIPYECFNNKYQKNYNFPLKPANWPWNGKIELRSVSVERKQISYPLLDSLNLTIEHGEVVGICSDYDNDVNLLFQLLNGFISPSKNDGSYAGDVIISDMNISSFGQVYATQAVILLDSNPICFNGTIRFNVDPYNQYTDQQVERALEAVKFWDEISLETDPNRFVEQFKTLNYVIQERGQQLPSSALQKLNFARAYLKKPKILLLQRAMSKIETSKYQFFYFMVRNLFRNSTIIILTLDLHYLMRCDRIIALRKGKIIQEGHPSQLAMNPGSRLYQMIKVLAESDYLKNSTKNNKESKATN